MKSPVVFDVDEVLAGFRHAYSRLARTLGRPDPGDSMTAPWDVYLDREVWAAIKASGSWWTTLPPMVASDTFKRIDALRFDRDVYFATSRAGRYARSQTVTWLEEHGVTYPQVIVTSKKGEFCKVVGAGYLLDDKPGNAVYAAYEAPETQACILDLPWNQFDHGVLGRRVWRVESVDRFLTIVEEDRRL